MTRRSRRSFSGKWSNSMRARNPARNRCRTSSTWASSGSPATGIHLIGFERRSIISEPSWTAPGKQILAPADVLDPSRLRDEREWRRWLGCATALDEADILATGSRKQDLRKSRLNYSTIE